MKIPFSVDEFFNLFKDYNQSVWPVQIILNLMGLISIVLLIKNGKQSSRIVFSVLAFLWVWMGLVYHILYFSSINKAAYLFGIFFILQGMVFLYFGVMKQKIQFEFNLQLSGVIGMVFIVYALIAYPILGFFSGHIYPRAPTFGVPCPTTIFTFGLLLYSSNRIPWYIVLIPFFWSLVGFSAAINLSVKEDFGLVIAGALSTTILVFYKPGIQSPL